MISHKAGERRLRRGNAKRPTQHINRHGGEKVSAQKAVLHHFREQQYHQQRAEAHEQPTRDQ